MPVLEDGGTDNGTVLVGCRATVRHLEYAGSVWCPYRKGDIEVIENAVTIDPVAVRIAVTLFKWLPENLLLRLFIWSRATVKVRKRQQSATSEFLPLLTFNLFASAMCLFAKFDNFKVKRFWEAFIRVTKMKRLLQCYCRMCTHACILSYMHSFRLLDLGLYSQNRNNINYLELW